MHLGIVAQRLKVTDADDRVLDGLLVYDVALIEGDRQTKPLVQQAGEYLELYLSHELNVDFLERFAPQHAQKRVFFLNQTEFLQQGVTVAAVRRQHAIGQNRFEHRGFTTRVSAQRLTGIGLGQTGYRAYRACIGTVGGLKTRT